MKSSDSREQAIRLRDAVDPKPQEVVRIPARELPVQRFLVDYVQKNRPVIVTHALESWDIAYHWTPLALDQRFGDQIAQVYNNYFDLQTVMPLRHYLSQYFGRPRLPGDGVLPYLRWYTQLRDERFYWADAIFAEMKSHWHSPGFLPESDYVFPLSIRSGVNPVTDPFPAKGLFVSPCGARTGLHVDPWGSCAVLCQLYGSKDWYLYSPDQAQFLRNSFGVVDVIKPDYKTFPEFANARLTAICNLRPGEVIYVPHGWFHQVECVSDSISLTWNFVHRTTAPALIRWLEQSTLSAFDESVLRFFFRLKERASVAQQVLAQIRAAISLDP